MNICVFGASSDDIPNRYKEAAYRVGELIAANGCCMVFGAGATGLMGAAAKGAAERGGRIVGILPEKLNVPGIASPHCDELIITATMRERKAMMEDMADAFIVLPGGIGTLEELMETLTLKQLGYMDLPICVLNSFGYYDALIGQMDSMAREGFVYGEHMSLFLSVQSPEEAVRYALEQGKP